MGCTKQVMHVALQQSDTTRERFMAEISVYDLECWYSLMRAGVTAVTWSGTVYEECLCMIIASLLEVLQYPIYVT